MRVLSLLVVALLLSPLFAGFAAAEAGTVTITLGRRVDVLTLSLRAGEGIDFAWSSAQGPVRFRVERSSDGADIFTQSGQIGQGTVPIPSDDRYVFSFQNENLFSVTLTWSITRRPDIVPWLIVGFAVVLVILGVLAILSERRRRMGWANLPPQSPMPPSR